MSDTPPPEIVLEKFLPFELVENILSRLPVKSLKRFRAVEKSWRHLIDSERFAKMHLNRSLASNSNRNLISGSPGFRWLSLDSLEKTHSVKLEFEYDTEDVDAISNSCNGLVVVKREPEPPILFNPFSREYKVLPLCPHFTPGDSSLVRLSCKTTYGFGYDSKNDDYKVVKVLLFESSSWMLSEEWIYSLRSDCWRRTKGTYYGRGNWPSHVNGALHTLVQSGSGVKIMGLSVVTEEDYEVARPEGIDTKGLVSMRLDVLDGYLALVCVYPSRFIVWVMEEYGVKESWAERISFGVGKDEKIRLLAYIDGRDKILVNLLCEELILLGGRKGSEERFKMPFPFVPRLCVETLVSPNCSAEKLKKEHRNKEKKEMVKKKKRGEFLSSGFKLAL